MIFGRKPKPRKSFILVIYFADRRKYFKLDNLKNLSESDLLKEVLKLFNLYKKKEFFEIGGIAIKRTEVQAIEIEVDNDNK